MLVVLPLHNGDRNLAVNLSAQIQRLSGVKNHECLIVCPQQTNLDNIENVLRESFGRLLVLRYPETMQGWPYGPNEAAAIAMIHCALNPELQYHYLMLEPDCVPTTGFWLDMLDMDYRRCGKQVLGVRIPTVEIATGRQVGTHTIGVAVYPKNFAQICPLVKSLVSMTAGYKAQGNMPMPWDAYFGAYTARMTADTTLIQHLSRVRNVDEKGAVTWDCPSLENALSQVNRQAVLIHGSKNPDFLAALTSPLPAAPQPIQNHAPQVRSQEHQQEHLGDAQREDLRESGPASRKENCRQDGGGSRDQRQQEKEVAAPPKKKSYMNYSEVPHVRKRQMAEAEAARIEQGIKFPLDTAPFARARYFLTQVKWPEVRSYASRLGVVIYKKKQGQLINDIVDKEMEEGKEGWTKELEPEQQEVPASATTPVAAVAPLPPVPVEEAPTATGFGLSRATNTAVQWKPVGSDGRLVEPPGNVTPLSDPKREQMKQMLESRGLRATA